MAESRGLDPQRLNVRPIGFQPTPSPARFTFQELSMYAADAELLTREHTHGPVRAHSKQDEPDVLPLRVRHSEVDEEPHESNE